MLGGCERSCRDETRHDTWVGASVFAVRRLIASGRTASTGKTTPQASAAQAQPTGNADGSAGLIIEAIPMKAMARPARQATTRFPGAEELPVMAATIASATIRAMPK